jgi:hypothetical protein
MVHTGKLSDVAAAFESQERSAVRSAVLESVPLRVGLANQDDRRVADARRQVVAGVGHLNFKTEIMPGGTPKQATLLREEYVWSLK